MAKLAIKGHPIRGKEVINLLEMLGANRLGYKDTFIGFYYYIECGAICSSDEYPTYSTIFTLEEFEEKFPYKVGDKVCYQLNLQIDAICVSKIISMKWVDNSVIYFTSNGHSLYACDLQPYKEETMEEEENFAECIEKTIQECLSGKEGAIREIKIDIDIPEGYEFFGIDNNKIVLTKIQPQYPKTYEECCKILGIEDRKNGYCGYEYELLGEFQQLLICRDAYWKIAGEQMGLGKPWKPDWNNVSDKHCIYFVSGEIWLTECQTRQCTLAFPTEEMRDEFYGNFKELIEQCKELL